VTVTLEEGPEQEFTIVGVSADFGTSQLTIERPQILLPDLVHPTPVMEPPMCVLASTIAVSAALLAGLQAGSERAQCPKVRAV
jgi:hypothetical protein